MHEDIFNRNNAHETYAKIAEENIDIFELFINRFSKLQDLMGRKLFSLIIELTEEPDPLRKIEALPSANQGFALRDNYKYSTFVIS